MRSTQVVLAASSVAVLLWCGAVLLTATYYVPGAGITYTTELSWSQLTALVPHAGWREVKNTLGVYDAAFCASVAIVITVLREASSDRKKILGLASPMLLLFPAGDRSHDRGSGITTSSGFDQQRFRSLFARVSVQLRE